MASYRLGCELLTQAFPVIHCIFSKAIQLSALFQVRQQPHMEQERGLFSTFLKALKEIWQELLLAIELLLTQICKQKEANPMDKIVIMQPYKVLVRVDDAGCVSDFPQISYKETKLWTNRF